MQYQYTSQLFYKSKIVANLIYDFNDCKKAGVEIIN